MQQKKKEKKEKEKKITKWEFERCCLNNLNLNPLLKSMADFRLLHLVINYMPKRVVRTMVP
jgi:hypothetical protein